MYIGVPKEIKAQEYRVGVIPSGVRELVAAGHTVMVEHDAGSGIGFHDTDYQQAGAEVVATSDELFARAEFIVKVKEPQHEECQRLRPGQILFAYLHLAPDPTQAQLLLASGCTAIAYETVTSNSGGLPLLAPMSQIAGRLSVHAAAYSLEKTHGGRGILISGVAGVEPAHVVVLGGGMVGSNAIAMALGLEAKVTVLEQSAQRLQQLAARFGSSLNTASATPENISDYIQQADVVIGAVLVPGANAPKLISHEQLLQMRRGAALVDVAIDQGGCFATSRPTTHHDPIFIVDDIVHYCVANMPGAVPRTASLALTNVTLPFILQIANRGVRHALAADPHLCAGLNVYAGQVTHPAVAAALHVNYLPAQEALA